MIRRLPFQYLLHWGDGEGITPSPRLLHLLLIYTLQCWLLSKETSSIFWVFGNTQLGIEPQSPRRLLNTLPTMRIGQSMIYIYIIIIMSCRQHGYPWPSLATSPYHSSPPAGLLGYILCPHIAAVCKFGLVVLLLLGHMWGSIGVCHLRARPCFSSSVRRVWLV